MTAPVYVGIDLSKDCLDGNLAPAPPYLAANDAAGVATSRTLLAALPELDTLTRHQVAALAPRNRDSGQHLGKRSIGEAGAQARSALYLAAWSASPDDPALKAFSDRLKGAGKAVRCASSPWRGSC